VDSYAIVTSEKTRRVFVRWEAGLKSPPGNPNDHFAPLRIRRLQRGFSITVRPDDHFSTSPLAWGLYAPVIEILRSAAPSAISQANGADNGREQNRNGV
jgi:hypothetical protein